MAEGILTHFGGTAYEVHSCGIYGSGTSPFAVQAQAELGIDSSRQWSKTWREVADLSPDVVVYLDAGAKARIAPFPDAGKELDWFIDDPIEARGSDEDIQSEYNRVRDLILARVKNYFTLDR